MKKLIAWILSCVMVFSLSACGNAEISKETMKTEKLKNFSSVEELMDYANDFWICATQYNDTQAYYKIRFFYDSACFSWDFSYSSNETLSDCLKNVLLRCEKQNKTFRSVLDLLLSGPSVEGLESDRFVIQYDRETSQINTEANRMVGKFLENGTFDSNGDIYRSDGNLSALSQAFFEAKGSIFADTYKGLVSYKDVKYDPDSHLYDYFLLTGTAELDDYYNYEYRDFESSYFCICVTPDGGGFTDRWYIYGDRYNSEFKELFEDLKEGPANVMLVCEARLYGAARHEMAELVDFCYK